MVVNVNMCASLFDETFHVLKFSAIAKKVLRVTFFLTEMARSSFLFLFWLSLCLKMAHKVWERVGIWSGFFHQKVPFN